MKQTKVIFHIDLDAFFAAVEQRDCPSLQGKPVIVGANPKQGKGRGVVSTCSYEARRYGVHSALPISQAYQLCPQGIFLPVNMQKYKKVSKHILRIYESFTPDVEPVSIDEAFLDMTESLHLFGKPQEAALIIKKKIYQQLALTVSIGIAPNKFVAKIASDLCKPDGLLEIKKNKIKEFLFPLNIDKLWGVGPKTKSCFNQIGVQTIADLAAMPKHIVAQRFGKHGRALYDLAHGRDTRDVEYKQDIKSVSHEHTFDKDTNQRKDIDQALLCLCEKISRRLRKDNLKGKTLTLKVRLKGFKTYSHAFTFRTRTNFTDIIYQKAKELFDTKYLPNDYIRLIGVRISNFESPYLQETLFIDPQTKQREKLHRAVDLIKNKYGEQAIHRAY